jgi:hypothetical protein
MSIIYMVEPQQRKLTFSDQFSYPRDILDFLSRTRFTEYGYMYRVYKKKRNLGIS